MSEIQKVRALLGMPFPEEERMKEFKVKVLVVQPRFMEIAGIFSHEEERIIRGYNLADAKKRAGID